MRNSGMYSGRNPEGLSGKAQNGGEDDEYL